MVNVEALKVLEKMPKQEFLNSPDFEFLRLAHKIIDKKIKE